MADPILQKSPQEPKKTQPKLDFEICHNGSLDPFIEATTAPDGPPPIINEASACYLSGQAEYLMSFLLETVSNLTRLHEYLTEIEKMLPKGGAR